MRKRCGAKLGIHRSRAGYLGGEDFQYDDNDRISFGDGELNVLHTPGHESGHCCFYEGGDKVLFSGDNILGYGTAVIHPPDGNMTDYMKSLGAAARIQYQSDPAGSWPAHRQTRSEDSRVHQTPHEREKQVLAALRSGKNTTGDITQMIYVDVSAALQRVAEFSVLAHLEKLVSEGRVKKEGSRYLLISEN